LRSHGAHEAMNAAVVEGERAAPGARAASGAGATGASRADKAHGVSASRQPPLATSRVGAGVSLAPRPQVEPPWNETVDRGRSHVFPLALAVAFALHLWGILGLQLAPSRAGPREQAAPALEVMLVQRPAPNERPDVADALAQVDRTGGGAEPPDGQTRHAADGVQTNAEVDPIGAVDPMEESLAATQDDRAADPSAQARPASAPAPPAAPDGPTPAGIDKLAVPEEAHALSLRVPRAPPPIPPDPLPPPEPLPEPPAEPAVPVTAAQILASRSQEVAELTARIRQNAQAYANRLRRRSISASTREFKYASYLEAWRRKVERIGNLNYPEEAKRHRMYGNLILKVAVRADGSIEHVEVLRSSGFDLLDEAAIKIVELAAPFAPFPPDIRAEADVLDITRTWQFQRSNRLGWED